MKYIDINKLLVCFLLMLMLTGFSQKKSYTTQLITKDVPRIDGHFDDEVWEEIRWENDFTQFEPNEGEQPSQQTAFKIVYDNDNIYVAIKSFDTEPEKIDKRMTRRDGWEGDLVGIHLDSYNDKRTGFVFAVSASGVKNDGFFSDDGDNFDDSWDPVWEVKTKITQEGWNAEMKIPFSQLRFSDKTNQIWGLELLRLIFRNEEISLWQPISKKDAGWVSNYGELHGINNIKPKKQIELAPFVLSKFDSYEKEEGNPFEDGKDFTADMGIDGKIALTNNLILDLTVNPDFGQVEADPSEVNLTAFETYFDEKRPFFIEGNNITDYNITMGDHPWGSDNLFYSRRIGRSPQYSPELANNQYIKMPDNSRILGAVKLTGKTEDGWSIGVIESITRNEKATIDTEGQRSKISVEPMTNYFIGRLQKDINSGNTLIGGVFTATNRITNEVQFDTITSKAYTGGIDFTQYFKNKKYMINTKFIFSQISGKRAAILDQQLSSRRYYQRPDADYITLDSNLTRLQGHGGNIMFAKMANSGLSYGVNFTWRSPGLELNDVGYLRQGDILFHFTWASYQVTKPFSIFRTVGANVNEWSGWDFGKNLSFFGYNSAAFAQFKNFWTFNLGFTKENEGLSNYLLRGGPSIKVPGSFNLFSHISTNSTKRLEFSGGVGLNWQDNNSGNNYAIFGGITYRPINALSIDIRPEYFFLNTDLQYLKEEEINETNDYIFGNMNQNTFNITARIDYNITPDLTIQYYGSPFVSGALFDEYKLITNPLSDNYSDRFQMLSENEINQYNIENNDFNFREFRSNMVLRWEYKPGSVVYFVWSQNRWDEVDIGKFDFFNDLSDLFSTKAQNLFLVKLSYRIRAGQWFH